jgi:hypothetical protein
VNQHDTLLAALRRGECLTVAVALSQYGCYALSQRIGELKRTHPEIETEMVRTATGKRIARYFIRQLELA